MKGRLFNTIKWCFILILSFVFLTNCGKLGDMFDKADDTEAELKEVDIGGGGTGSMFNVSGTLNLSSSTMMMLLVANEDNPDETATSTSNNNSDCADATMILKASYAMESEDMGCYNSNTKEYSIKVKMGQAFFLNGFDTNGQPVCSWMFTVEGQSSSSFLPIGDLNLGEATCGADGQVNIKEELTEGKVDGSWKKRLLEGDISDGVKTALFDSLGLSLIPLSHMFGDDKGGPNEGPGGPGFDDGQGPPPDDGGCYDCGGPDWFATPQKCRDQMGYSIPDWHDQMGDFQENMENMRPEDFMPTLYFKEHEEEDGTMSYSISVESKDWESGKTEYEVIKNVKLTGVDDDFTFIGDNQIDPREITLDVASEMIRKIIDNTPKDDQFSDFGGFFGDQGGDQGMCDPAWMQERIFREMLGGAKPYDVEDLWGGQVGGGWHDPNQQEATKCVQDVEPGEEPAPVAEFISLKEYCLTGDKVKDEDGNEIDEVKSGSEFEISDDMVLGAAEAICGAYSVGARYDYWSNEGSNCSCEQWENTNWGSSPTGVVDDNATTDWECTDWEAHPHEDNKWWQWQCKVWHNRWEDCKTLISNGQYVGVCRANLDWEAEQTLPQNLRDVWINADNWWDWSMKEADEEAMSQIAMHEMGMPMDEIDMCLENFENSRRDLEKRKEKLSVIQKAVETIKNAVDADGNPVYITDEATDDQFKSEDDFTMTTETLEDLERNMKRLENVLTLWDKALATGPTIYNVLKAAALKADSEDKCLVEEMDTKEKFLELYEPFLAAMAHSDRHDELPPIGSIALLGLKANNHSMCMGWDENVQKIMRFGLHAPRYSDSAYNFEDDDETGGGGMWLKTAPMEGEEEATPCPIPPGGKTFFTFKDLQNMATTSDGCNEITEKVAAVGRMTRFERHEMIQGPFGEEDRYIPAGALDTLLKMVRSKPANAVCTVTVHRPKAKQGCWVYKKTAEADSDLPENYYDVEDEDRGNVLAGDYELATASEEVAVEDIFEENRMHFIMLPNSFLHAVDEGGELDKNIFDDLLN